MDTVWGMASRPAPVFAVESVAERGAAPDFDRAVRRWSAGVGWFFSVFLVFPVVRLLGGGAPPVVEAVTLGLLAVYALGHFVFAYRFGVGRPGAALAVVAGMAAVLGALWALHGAVVAPTSLFVLTAAAIVLPVRWGAVVNAVLLGGLVALYAVDRGGAFTLPLLILVVSVTACATTIGVLVRTLEELHRARAEFARFAVVAERERLSRDLHDVLGHTLTTIAVKTGLARRLLDTDSADRARLRAEVADSEGLARQSMAQLRAVVSEYRARLPAELAGARFALRAVAIEVELPESTAVVEERFAEAFAYVVREGVTNVIRHATASRCRISVGPDWIEVADDGSGCGEAGAPGNGLRGLAERMTAVGGRVVFTASGAGHLLRAEAGGAG